MTTPENASPATAADWPVGVNIAIVVCVLLVLSTIAGAAMSAGEPQRASAADCAGGTEYVETYSYDHVFKTWRVNGSCEPV